MDTTKFAMFRVRSDGFGSEPSEVHAAYSRAKAARAEIIDAVTIVELELNQLLCYLLAGRDVARTDLLMNTVLTAEFCTLFQKWRILRSALLGQEIAEDRKKQLSRLKELISMRNAFAHGELVIDGRTLVVTLKYREGEIKSLVITDLLVSSVLEKASLSFAWVSSLLHTAQTSSQC